MFPQYMEAGWRELLVSPFFKCQGRCWRAIVLFGRLENREHAWTTGSILVGRLYFHPLLVSSAHPWHFSRPFSPSPLPRIYQSCNPVVFAERIRMCPWQRMKEKSTGIKFHCNCLLNCGLQLLKFYPWFCVTTAVMNSVWLWFSHWRHARSELEKRWVGGGAWGLAGVVGMIWRGLKASQTKAENQNTHWLILCTYWTINTTSATYKEEMELTGASCTKTSTTLLRWRHLKHCFALSVCLTN